MTFTPHTDEQERQMLTALALADADALFAHIPKAARMTEPLDVAPGMSELEVMRYVEDLGRQNRGGLVCFAGGGVYDHHLPPVVRSLTMRPEFVTSYTPYQSEVAQGVLQALFEYQSMVAAITGLPVANASLYDGASAGIEAVNLALAETGRDTVWVSRGLHPHTRQVIATFAHARGVTIIEHPLEDGRTAWNRDAEGPPAALVFGQPNYLGIIEEYDTAVALAAELGALTAASVDPMLLGLLRTPGDAGCDIAFAEGQPLGNPLSFGGPVVGIFAVAERLMRRIPGRLSGETVDREGRRAYTLTLRTREQDIRREKASSNICTNQTLNAVAAAIHLAWLGPDGLAEVGQQSSHKARYLRDKLTELPGVSAISDAPYGREFGVTLPIDTASAVRSMADRGYLAGIPLDGDYPEYRNGLLIAVTEKRSRQELDGFAHALGEVIANG